MTAQGKVAGAWKDISQIQAKISGSWKEVNEGYVKVAGNWNQFFAPAPSGSFDLLDTEVLDSSSASLTFSSLSIYASEYKHLQIRMVARSDEAGSSNLRDLRIRANGDTGSNYSGHVLRGDGSGVYTNFTTSQTSISTAFALLPRPSNPTSQYGAAVIDILNAFETTNYSTFRMLAGAKPTGEDQVWLGSGAWLNTAAITSITLFANSGNLANGSQFRIYGIRG